MSSFYLVLKTGNRSYNFYNLSSLYLQTISPTSSEPLLHHFLFFIFTITEKKKKISLCTFLYLQVMQAGSFDCWFLGSFKTLLRSALHLQIKFSSLTVHHRIPNTPITHSVVRISKEPSNSDDY